MITYSKLAKPEEVEVEKINNLGRFNGVIKIPEQCDIFYGVIRRLRPRLCKQTTQIFIIDSVEAGKGVLKTYELKSEESYEASAFSTVRHYLEHDVSLEVKSSTPHNIRFEDESNQLVEGSLHAYIVAVPKFDPEDEFKVEIH